MMPLDSGGGKPMRSTGRWILGLVLFLSLAGSVLMALAPQAPRVVTEGVYTTEQATRGLAVYTARCATCHAPNLVGRTGPPLTGDDFLGNWETQPLSELANKIAKTMPRGEREGKPLTPQEAADVLAYILQVGKFRVGGTELKLDEAALKQVNFPVRTGAAPRVAATQQPALPITGNVGQVMRGILFPSANIVFTTQTIDPGVKREPPKDDSTGGFDWFAWGGSVYSGWDMVDYAAISVAESATLMLTPGRRCENGRLVPVTDPDWIKFTQELLDAGKASFKASQTRNQQLVSDSTNQLNESCMNCHRVFRGRVHCAKP
jgi:mono/diheme cytochrome c family protein